MNISASTETTVKSVSIHGCDNMAATAKNLSANCAAVMLHQEGSRFYTSDISLFFSGPGACAKAARVADAINAAMAEPLALQTAAE